MPQKQPQEPSVSLTFCLHLLSPFSVPCWSQSGSEKPDFLFYKVGHRNQNFISSKRALKAGRSCCLFSLKSLIPEGYCLQLGRGENVRGQEKFQLPGLVGSPFCLLAWHPHDFISSRFYTAASFLNIETVLPEDLGLQYKGSCGV